MTPDEIASYRFRVGRMHFQELTDAIKYAEACLYATHVDFRWPNGEWKLLWQDGDVQYSRPGFAVLVPYKR